MNDPLLPTAGYAYVVRTFEAKFCEPLFVVDGAGGGVITSSLLRLYVNLDECDAQYGTSCYVFVSTPLTWEGARSRCILDGGHLATIDSKGENDVIQKIAICKFYM